MTAFLCGDAGHDFEGWQRGESSNLLWLPPAYLVLDMRPGSVQCPSTQHVTNTDLPPTITYYCCINARPAGALSPLSPTDNHHFDGMLNNGAKSRLEKLAEGDPRLIDMEMQMGHHAAVEPYHPVEAPLPPPTRSPS